MMQHARRKRRVTTCVPCYTRKQKCNRHYPCNHCTKRRRPEECVYNSTSGGLTSRDQKSVVEVKGRSLGDIQGLREQPGIQGTDVSPITLNGSEGHTNNERSALAKSFGYHEDSNSNTMALLRNVSPTELLYTYLCRGLENNQTLQLDLNSDADADMSDKSVSSHALETIERDLERIPHRQVLDFLVQYFVSELNWMKQIVHPASFLTRYEQWWIKDRPLPVDDVEFAVLILRICSYAAQFLPPSSQIGDMAGGPSLSDIRDTCGIVGDSLFQACQVLNWKGSLVRVQHILYIALKSSCEGRTDKFWEGIASASRAAQKAGIHTDSAVSGDDGVQELEKKMRRRTFCSLYVLDSHLSRQLDRVPFLPDNLVAETLPRLRLVSDLGDIATDVSAPEMFTERLMQVQLGRFWRSFGPRRNSEYDPIKGEQRYERFCAEYIPTLLPAFALESDTKWDNHLPKLPMQRQLLHIAIFDSVCWNFRPLLLLKASYIASLAPYKQVLLQSQKKRMAMATLKELEAISTLHSMFGGSHTRFAAIIFNTFEAAVLLLSLCSHTDFPFDQGEENAEILGLEFGQLTRERSMKAAEEALRRLHMLSEDSDMAASGARVVTQLYAKAMRDKDKVLSELETSIESSHSSSWSNAFPNLVGLDGGSGHLESSEHSNPEMMTDFLSTMAYGDSYSELELPSLDLTTTIPWTTGDTE